MAGNQRNFGALTLQRLVRNMILGGGHTIPIPKNSRAPVEQAELCHPSTISSKNNPSVLFQSPPDIHDDFLDDNDDPPCLTTLVDTPTPARPDNAGDYLFDEIVPDVQFDIIDEEGFNYYSG